MPKTIEISHRTVIFTVLFLGFVWFLIQINLIILSLFVSVLISTALNPLVDQLQKLRLPRPLAIFIIYIILIGAFVTGISSLLPPLIEQSTNLGSKMPLLFDQTSTWLKSIGITNIDSEMLSGQLTQLGAIPANLVLILAGVLSNLISVFTVLVISFYLMLERKNFNHYLALLFGDGNETNAKKLIDKLELKLGGWVRGELMLMVIVGLMTFTGLTLLGIPYALPLAILAGFLEIVPGIGPFISAIPGVLLGLTISPVMAIATAVLYFLVQQVENTVIVPKVMQKATGINPLITMISLTIGFKLAGVMGAILAVPIVIVLHVIVVEVLEMKRLDRL